MYCASNSQARLVAVDQPTSIFTAPRTRCRLQKFALACKMRARKLENAASRYKAKANAEVADILCSIAKAKCITRGGVRLTRKRTKRGDASGRCVDQLKLVVAGSTGGRFLHLLPSTVVDVGFARGTKASISAFSQWAGGRIAEVDPSTRRSF